MVEDQGPKMLNLEVEQGAVQVNDGWVLRESNDVVALEVDMRTKHASICGWGSGEHPTVSLEPNRVALFLHPEEEGLTEITFADYGEDWTIHSAVCLRYTLSVCLVKINRAY